MSLLPFGNEQQHYNDGWAAMMSQMREGEQQARAEIDRMTVSEGKAVMEARRAAQMAQGERDQAQGCLDGHEHTHPSGVQTWASQKQQLTLELSAYQRLLDEAITTLRTAENTYREARGRARDALIANAQANYNAVSRQVDNECKQAAAALAQAQQRGRKLLEDAAAEVSRVSSLGVI